MPDKISFDFSEGEILLFDKPLGWTSFDVVNKVRYVTKAKKVGHAGTLDPLATGLLIVCTGKFTKKIQEIQYKEKEYVGGMILGGSTPSYDLETEVNQTFDISHITEKMISETAKKFTGNIQQAPPLYSAKNINGERAYRKARRGETAVMELKEVSVPEFEITKIALPEVMFRVVCSTGTYIRSLVHDLGFALNSGAYLSSLSRTRIGGHKLQDAWQLADFVEHINKEWEEKKFL